MKFLESVKAYLGNRVLYNSLQTLKRNVATCNIEKANNIGILFNATYQVNFEIVKNLVKTLNRKEVHIEVLGYVDSKQLIDHYLYRKGFDFFTQNQLNWYYKPTTENVGNFIKEPFDILLNLSLDNPFPIQYILANSSAKFKAGCYSEGQQFLDFMIDIEKEKNTLNDIQNELIHDATLKRSKNGDVEKIVDNKIQTEVQLNFLINQLLHYLSILKN